MTKAVAHFLRWHCLIQSWRLKFVLGITFILVGCTDQKNSYGIQFILPLGFEGAFEIVERETGKPILPENEEWLYRVPAHGRLVVHKANGLRAWHKPTARFENGQSIPVQITSDPERRGNEVVMYYLDSSEDAYHFFVGTREQMIEYLRTRPLENELARFLAGQMQTNSNSPKQSNATRQPPNGL